MTKSVSIRNNLPIMALALMAAAMLVVLYFVPVWWVSLKAPNYPPEAFPNGVRIHFHMNGVFNGCTKIQSAEIQEDEALDCVHEMDTINHYVGMYPIAAGGVIERAFSPFLVAMMCVMLLSFACSKPALRRIIMSAGFGAVVVWMTLTFYSANGLKYQSSGYVESMVTSMDQEAGKEEVDYGTGIVGRLKREMAALEAKDQADAVVTAQDKSGYIDSLKITYEKDRERRGVNEVAAWNGDGRQLLLWHYEKSLGRYFNNPDEINPMVHAMGIAFYVVFFGIIGAMLLLLVGAARTRNPLYWVLALVPALLPLFFLIDYSAWLWWYGHRLNEMGAFTVKAFMPTVFGDGKVAQFSTHSYPYWGFGLMMAISVVVALMLILRRKQLNRDSSA